MFALIQGRIRFTYYAGGQTLEIALSRRVLQGADPKARGNGDRPWRDVKLNPPDTLA